MYCEIGLIVTGEGERDFLPSLFRTLTQRATCSFRVLGRTGQRRPITSPARRLEMAGTHMIIPTTDEWQIGIPARRFLRDHPGRFIVLVDDIEGSGRAILGEIFTRYRTALDTMLRPEERQRSAVLFLANMLEAYYFADSAATNAAMGHQVLAGDHAGDVEDIPHPKRDMKELCPGFHEREDGARIVSRLDLDHVLDRQETCAFLRSMFGWLVERLVESDALGDPDLPKRYHLADGIRQEPMKSQVVS